MVETTEAIVSSNNQDNQTGNSTEESSGNGLSSKDSSKAKRYTGRNRNGYNGNRGYVQVDKHFTGVTPEIGGVLTLPTEGYVVKRLNFEKFQEALITYVVKTFSEAATSEVTKAIRNLEDPVEAYDVAKNQKLKARLKPVLLKK